MKNYSEDASRQYHIQVAEGEIGRYVIMPGDPKRCVKIAQYFDNPILVADNREYITYTGTLNGVKVSVTSTGIGGPSGIDRNGRALSLWSRYFHSYRNMWRNADRSKKSGDVVVATGRSVWKEHLENMHRWNFRRW